MHGAALPDVLELQEARHSSGSAAHHRGNTPTALHHRGLQRPGDGVLLFVAGSFSRIVVDFNMFSYSVRGQRKRWEDNIREWTGLELGKSQRAVENRGKWRKLVAKSSVVSQRPSRLRD